MCCNMVISRYNDTLYINCGQLKCRSGVEVYIYIVAVTSFFSFLYYKTINTLLLIINSLYSR